MIADIFGITSDELLRGERNTQANDSMQNEVKNRVRENRDYRF